MDTLVPGVTNSKKHFIITLQHINSLGQICAFWQLGVLQAPAFLHIALFVGGFGPEAGGRGWRKGLAAQSPLPSPGAQAAPVICWGSGWCGRTAPQG